MEYLGLLVMGILLSTLGIVNIRGNISTIHAWNRKRVKEADIPRYGRAIGAGTLVIGLGIGLALILYAQLKYNHGIF